MGGGDLLSASPVRVLSYSTRAFVDRTLTPPPERSRSVHGPERWARPANTRCYPPRMPIVVQKYGGTSVGATDRIRGVADGIVRAREQGQDVVVVVSAMGETTDDLLDKASDITPVPEPRELDMLLTA